VAAPAPPAPPAGHRSTDRCKRRASWIRLLRCCLSLSLSIRLSVCLSPRTSPPPPSQTLTNDVSRVVTSPSRRSISPPPPPPPAHLSLFHRLMSSLPPAVRVRPHRQRVESNRSTTILSNVASNLLPFLTTSRATEQQVQGGPKTMLMFLRVDKFVAAKFGNL